MMAGLLPFDPDALGLVGDLALGAGGGALLFALFIVRAVSRGPETGLDPCAGCDGSACDSVTACPSIDLSRNPLAQPHPEVTP